MVSTIRQHAGAGVVAAAVIVAAFAHGLFDPTGYAAGSILIWAAVTAGLAGRAIPLSPVGTLTAVAGICLAVIAVLAFLSVNWASDQGRAFDEAVRASFYAGLFVLAACTASLRGRDEWLAGLTIGLAVVSVVALFAYLQPGSLGGRSDIPGAVGRLSYPVGYWNAAAALLATATVLLAHAGAAASARQLRIAATALIPLSVLAMWLTDSRGGALAAALALVALIAASPSRSRQLVAIGIGLGGAAVLVAASESMHALTRDVADSASRADGDRMSVISVLVVGLTAVAASRFGGAGPDFRFSRRAGLAIGVIAALAAVVALVATDPAQRFSEFKAPPPTRNGVAEGGAELSSNGRWQFWSSSVNAFESEPLRGVGAGGFESWWGVHGDVPLFVRNPHSLPLQTAVDFGIPGIALFVGFCAALAVCCRRRLSARRAADTDVLLAVFICGASGAAFDWTWEIPAVIGPAVVCSALIISSAPSLRGLRGRLWGGLAILAACAGMVAGGVVVLSEQNLRLSREAAADGKVEEAINRAKAARSIEPWSADPYTQLALLEEQRGDISAALSYLKQAEDRDSQDWRLPVIEATLLQRRGDFSSARTAYLRAGRLSPLPVKSIVFAPPSQG